VAFKRFTQKQISVVLPDCFEEQSRLQVLVMCDSYIGLDQHYTIDIQKVNSILARNSVKSRAKGAEASSGKVFINAKAPEAEE